MKKFAIAAALLLLLTPAAWAGAYVGASLGQSDATSSGISGDDTSWKIVGGYTFMKFMGVEGSYRNLGGIDDTIGTTSIDLEASSMDVFGVGILPVGEKFELFAKAGYARVELEASISDPLVGTISGSVSENELAYGAGFNFKVGEKIALRVEYETFDTTDSLDMTSVGAVFRF